MRLEEAKISRRPGYRVWLLPALKPRWAWLVECRIQVRYLAGGRNAYVARWELVSLVKSPRLAKILDPSSTADVVMRRSLTRAMVRAIISAPDRGAA